MKITSTEEDWIKENLEKIDFFKSLEPLQVLQLVSSITAKNYDGGQEVIRQGHHGDNFFLIFNGDVSVWISKNNQDQKIANLSHGDYFGEISLLTGRPATATVRALKPTRLFFLNAELFLKMVRENPTLSTTVQSTMKKRLETQKIAMATMVGENVAAISAEIESFLNKSGGVN